MKNLIIVIAFLGGITLQAQHLNVGVKAQKTQLMYWENGISARYSFASFKPDQFQVGLDYITSRLGTAFQSNALKQDSYIASATWYFIKEKAFHFFTKFNMGYFHVNLEEDFFDELPNTAFLLSPEVGFSYDFKNLPIAINLGSGYNIGLVEESKSPGTLQPLFYNLTVYYKLFQNPRI